jgi:hypothetical protein
MAYGTPRRVVVRPDGDIVFLHERLFQKAPLEEDQIIAHKNGDLMNCRSNNLEMRRLDPADLEALAATHADYWSRVLRDSRMHTTPPRSYEWIIADDAGPEQPAG